MRIELLTVPNCPNRAPMLGNLDDAMEELGLRDVVVSERSIETPAQAEGSGMHGSPTLLIDGVDPFAPPGTEPSLSCRRFLDGDRFVPVPTAEQLRHVLRVLLP